MQVVVRLLQECWLRALLWVQRVERHVDLLLGSQLPQALQVQLLGLLLKYTLCQQSFSYF